MSSPKAITIRQPWAQAVADGHKRIENRSQGFPKGHRGILLIHAAQGWSERGCLDQRVRDVYPRSGMRSYGYALRHVPAYHGRPPHPFRGGVVLAVAVVADIHPASGCCAPWGEDTYEPANPEGRPPGRVTHLVLDLPIPLPQPVEARGALGLWKPDPDLRLEVAHRLADLVDWDPTGARRVAERGDIDQLHSLLTEPQR